MTHCVSANDARALTQMDTNTTGTPKVIKKNENKTRVWEFFCSQHNNGAWRGDGTPANDDEGPQVVPIWEEGHEDEAVEVQALHQDPVMVGRQKIKKERNRNLTAGLWKQMARKNNTGIVLFLKVSMDAFRL